MKKPFSTLLGFSLVVIGFCCSLAVLGQEPVSPLPPIEILVRRAMKHNPGLEAQRRKILAALEVPSQAGALPDPAADLQFMMLPMDGGLNADDALTKGVSLGITQRLPYPGKLKLRKRKAERRIDVARTQLKAMESNLRGEVTGVSYHYALYRRLLEINRKTQDALEAAAKGAAGVYASGNGSQTDVLLAQAAFTKNKADRKTLNRQLEVARARLDDLLGGPTDPALLDRIAIPEPGDPPRLNSLVKDLQDTAPMVLKAQAEVAVRAEQVAIAKKDFKPDFLVGGRYRHKDMTMGGRDYLTAMVGITLPFFHRKSRYQPALREATYMRESAREQAGDVLNEARYMVTDAYQTGVQDRDVYALYKNGLLIQAKKAYESSLASYTVGEVDFTTMLRALTNYYAYESRAFMARADYQVSLARIEAVLGHTFRMKKKSDPSVRSIKDFPKPVPHTVQKHPFPKEEK